MAQIDYLKASDATSPWTWYLPVEKFKDASGYI